MENLFVSFFSICSGEIPKFVNVTFQVQHKQLLEVVPGFLELNATHVENRSIMLVGKAPGHSEVMIKVEPNDTVE